MSKKLSRKIIFYIRRLQRYANRFWYPPFIGFLAAIDNLVIVIPNDGILISSSMLTPRRWFVLALCITIGSTLGSVALAALVEFQGLPWFLNLYPSIIETRTWTLSYELFEKYGMLLLFAVAISPIMQQPAVILSGIANTPLIKIATVVFVGRFIKFLIMAYLASHAPHVLNKMWGLKKDLKGAGVKIQDKGDFKIP